MTTDDNILSRASHWFVQHTFVDREAADPARRQQIAQGFEAWLAEDPRHGEAFERFNGAWALMRELYKLGYLRS